MVAKIVPTGLAATGTSQDRPLPTGGAPAGSLN
jgi:hypothetical protein